MGQRTTLAAKAEFIDDCRYTLFLSLDECRTQSAKDGRHTLPSTQVLYKTLSTNVIVLGLRAQQDEGNNWSESYSLLHDGSIHYVAHFSAHELAVLDAVGSSILLGILDRCST